MNLIELFIRLGLITEDQAATLTAVAEHPGDDLTDVDAEALQDAADIYHTVVDAILDLDAADQTDDHVAAMEGSATVLIEIGGEQDTRAATVEERTSRIAELGDQIRPEDDDAEIEVVDETADETDDTEDDDDDGGGETVDEDDDATPADDGETPEEVVAETVEDLEPVAAASVPVVSRVAARRPTHHMPPARPAPMSDDISTWGMVASANSPGFEAGAPIRSEGDLVEAFTSAWDTAQAFTGPASNVRVLSMRAGYDAERQLGGDVGFNEKAIAASQRRLERTAEALVASGGNPAPEEVRYDQPVIGSEARPVRDSFLNKFGATRGGVRVTAPPRLDNLKNVASGTGAAASVHTDANDISGNSKTYATVTAGLETTQLVSAIVKRLRFGEFQDRFLPELIASWVKLASVSHARLAEETLIASVASSGINVSAGDDIMSATRDILSQLDRLAISIRSRERLEIDYGFDVLLPDWVYALIRSDLSRQQPGGGTVNDETLAVSDATIERFFAIRNIRPVWSCDMQVFGEQGVGAIQGFPDTVVGHFCAPGAHLFLDGGQLNLGIVRDSALNDTNDIEMFSETFEEHLLHHQIPAYQITMDVDPSGTTSIAAAFDPSVTGS